MLAATSAPRLDPKRRNVLDSRKRQFAKPAFAEQTYPHRLNFYNVPPTGDISLEEFEEWGIARLKVLGELEACHFRNRSPAETEEYMKPVIDKHLRLSSNMSRSSDMEMERKRDHYSHWTLRLAFSGTKDLRERFARLETQLFKLRLQHDDTRERKEFIESLPMAWEVVGEDEKRMYMDELKAATRCGRDDEEAWFKVDWEKVPELVERRQVLLKRGSAFVHVREQMSIVTNEFARNLETGLELAARFLPRMDEDNRLAPILHHLSQSFVAPDAGYSEASSIGDISTPTAASIDGLSQHFPLCMQNLHKTLRANNHLKHFGRLQYTLFLKGIGLSLQECIIFWRKSFKNFTDGKFWLHSLETPQLPAFALQRNKEPVSLTQSLQKNLNPNTNTTSVTPMATSAATPTVADAGTRPIRARNYSPKHHPAEAKPTAAPTAPTARTT